MAESDRTDPAQARQAIKDRWGLSDEAVTALMRQKSLTEAELLALPESRWPRALRKLSTPDLPRRRAEHLARRYRAGADAQSGAQLHLAALDRMRAMRAETSPGLLAGVPVGAQRDPAPMTSRAPAAGLDPNTWTFLGPGNVGGRTRAIVSDPDVANRLWAGAAGGGLWRSDDGGASWTPIADHLNSLAVCAVAFSPVRSADGTRLMLVGTGEGFNNADAIAGAGIFSSTDGTTWSVVTATVNNNFQAVNRLAFSADGTQVYAATNAGLFGAYASSLNSWNNLISSAAIADVRAHPTDATRAVAADFSGAVYVTTDSGAQWSNAAHAGAWAGRIELTYAAADPQVVYAAIDQNGGEIWRSSDGGANFAAMGSQIAGGTTLTQYLGNQGYYANALWAGDPGDVNAVMVGGYDLWRSLDGGSTLTRISSHDLGKSVHADHHVIVSDARIGAEGVGGRVYFGNDGGIFATDDYRTVGASADYSPGWRSLSNTYGVTQFYGIAVDAANSAVYGGAQDNGTVRYGANTGPNAWTTVLSGDGGMCAVDRTTPANVYGEYIFGQVFRSVDAGQHTEDIWGHYWDGTQWVILPAPYVITEAQANQGEFIAPVALDQSQPQRLLVGLLSLWRTENALAPIDHAQNTGVTWATIKDPAGSNITAVAVSPDNADQIWVGHRDGQIFATVNGTQATPNWNQISASGVGAPGLARLVSAVHIPAGGNGEVFIAYEAYANGAAGGNLWLQAPATSGFADISANLPDTPIHAVTRHPSLPGYLYVGTEIGLFASEDGGQHWAPTNEGPTNAPVRDFGWSGNILICATHGRGAWCIEIPPPTPTN